VTLLKFLPALALMALILGVIRSVYIFRARAMRSCDYIGLAVHRSFFFRMADLLFP